MPRGMDSVVKDAILELPGYTYGYLERVTYLVANKDVCSILYPGSRLRSVSRHTEESFMHSAYESIEKYFSAYILREEYNNNSRRQFYNIS